ncbi:aldo/keto reductase [Devosia sp.]|uniref:aldo/keto reductase n=1 Tax=Devosia sp. TaxID=1871048 RepID=UPI003265BA8D
MSQHKFNKRSVGQTALKITELGFGAATIAGNFKAVAPEDARNTVSHALDLGINYVDTAPQYGYGRSEHMVGDVVRERRDEVVLATKVGRLLKPAFNDVRTLPHNWANPLPFDQHYEYTYDAVMRSFEDSLQRMGVNRIDILYVHDIGVMTHGVEGNKPLWKQLETGGYKALRELRDSGVVSAIGFGVNEWEVLMDALDLGDWDVFLLAGRYTLLEQTSLSPFLEKCLARKTSVVAAAPFNGGALMGSGTWNYGKAPDHIISRVAELEAICKEFNVPIGAAALQFPLTHPAVCSVLTGPKSVSELDGVVAWWNTPIPNEFWTALVDRGLVAQGTPLPQ